MVDACKYLESSRAFMFGREKVRVLHYLVTLADFLLVPNNAYLAYHRNVQIAQEKLYEEIGQLKYQNSNNTQAMEELNQLKNSTSWKITAPLRKIMKLIHKG